MKKIALTAALILSSGVYAGTFNSSFEAGNSDLYDGVGDSQKLPTAVQPGIGDAYGSVLLPGGYADSQHVVQKGTNDGYGSILIDIGHDLDW
ncbi:MAG: hypothetical protein ABFS39_10095 [Pseudomonadota bacterium]